ncbi:RNA polymerase, sigma subunit, SigW [Terribacillus aidingensis]|jgi:RNA polymerase sigma-70 factor, ECF subfamily|uniref:RNA polymerase sigma factor n=1 Tax=Terribacillus aidingensis TaxID=586416 RepID=A0A285P7A7_9BACI|nr:RNA polymerase sigma factor SigW [Terribacillus aidingensis]SNZ17614.1 RNA polymerase, sigma subunit, SigW [Terribacillus aidingensis]
MENIIKHHIKNVKKGDQAAFEEIVSFYQNKVYHIVFRMIGDTYEAQDIAQEAFIRAYTNIHSFDENRKFSTWLYRIATNLSIDRLRKKKPDYHLDAEVKGTEGLDMYSQLAADQALPEEEVQNMELQSNIHKEILSLPPKYRGVIVLRFLDDLSLAEIGEILDLPLGTVKTRIHRGRELLRKKLRHV